MNEIEKTESEIGPSGSLKAPNCWFPYCKVGVPTLRTFTKQVVLLCFG